MKIVIDDKIPFVRGAFEPFATVVYKQGKTICHDDVADADALLIRTRTRCNAKLLDNSKVRAIFTATIGFDHIDIDYCKRHNIYWTNAPGCNAKSVQQYMASAFAELHFRLGKTLKNSIIAIVGVGNVGSKIEELANLLGMQVLRVDPLRAEREGCAKFTPYNDALATADIVTFHTPLTFDGKFATHHLFNAKSLELLKHGAIVINTSRGEVVDTQSITKGIDEGKISAAIIDVWENEPEISRELIERAFIATPHIAGYSIDSKRNGSAMSIASLSRFFGIENPNWHIAELPEPLQGNIFAPLSTDDAETAACRMFRFTYNISMDDTQLRFAPQSFEYQRSNYPMRREIEAFKLKADDVAHAAYLRKFGIK